MRKALGKGLEALFPGTPAAPAPAALGERLVPIEAITPNPDQPRRVFEEEALASLADSVRRHGLLQPLVVRRVGPGYELIAGERRLRAAERAGLERVPVVVRDTPAEQRFELALIENLQREDLTPLEEAEAYQRLIQEYGLTQEDVAVRVGKSRSTIANALRLLGLPEPVKTQLESGELSAGHARAVLAVDPEERVGFAREIASARVSKHEAETRAAARRTKPAGRPANGSSDALHVRAVADELTRALGTRVRIVTRARGGSIEIEFYSTAELNGLVDRLRAGGGRAAML